MSMLSTSVLCYCTKPQQCPAHNASLLIYLKISEFMFTASDKIEGHFSKQFEYKYPVVKCTFLCLL